MAKKKTALVITYGPTPTPQYQKIEGGGMRAWGLATGLSLNGVSVTVAVNEGFPQDHASVDDVKLVNWSLNDHFKQFINGFDMVIVSYCMGDVSMFIADNIEDDVTLVLDAYVPIYIEVSARDSEDKKTELINYEQDIQRFNHVLLRGDYFLCANTPQKHMYAGAIQKLTSDPRFKFVLVGGKNPYNNHPAFVKQYEYVADSFKQSHMLGKSVFMVDWVDFDKRLEWYQGANAVISINQPGEENVYSWRTRIMDYVWGGVPIITNGGDPLSDQLLQANAALQISTEDDSIVEVIGNLLSQPAKLLQAKKSLAKLRQDFYWENVVPFL
jgi:hypothetical protein